MMINITVIGEVVYQFKMYYKRYHEIHHEHIEDSLYVYELLLVPQNGLIGIK